jgi:hypothetical protein
VPVHTGQDATTLVHVIKELRLVDVLRGLALSPERVVCRNDDLRKTCQPVFKTFVRGHRRCNTYILLLGCLESFQLRWPVMDVDVEHSVGFGFQLVFPLVKELASALYLPNLIYSLTNLLDKSSGDDDQRGLAVRLVRRSVDGHSSDHLYSLTETHVVTDVTSATINRKMTPWE